MNDTVILLKLYSKWLELFPFELSYFSKLKKYFSENLPLINEKPIYNPYTGKSKAKITTKEDLLNLLVERTRYLLDKVSGSKLEKAGILKTKNKIILKGIEILNESSELELKELYISKNDDSKRYRKNINKWFKNQERYFNKLYEQIKKKDEILKESKQETKKINNTKKIHNSYTYKKLASNYTAITDVFNSLKNKFICDNTKSTNFKYIFQNKIPKLPIKWIHDKIALYYFIKLLFDRKLIDEIPNKWEVTCNIFIDKNSNKFPVKNFGRQSKPSKEISELLERVVNNL